MKKIFLLLIAILPLVAMAQNDDMHVSIEPHVGMTISKMDGNALNGSKTWKTGWTAGAEVEIPLSSYYSLTTGVDYSLIGTGFKERKEKYSSSKSHINAIYVSVPLQVKAYFPQVKGLAAHIGAEIGFLTSAKVHAEATSIRTMDIGDGMSSYFLWENYKVKESEDVSKLFRNIIYDIPVGLSYEWRNIMFNATYRFEIRTAIHNNAYNSGWMASQEALTARHHAILVTLGYKFKL
jgi:hypothetical protein